MEVFAFAGAAGSGKDFLAEQLAGLLPPARAATVAFADHLKVQAAVRPAGGVRVDIARCFGAKDAATRAVLQREGTELGRDVLGPDVWVEFWRAWVAVHRARGATRFFVPDVRFANEVAALRALRETEGAAVYFFEVRAPARAAARARAEGREAAPVHASEAGVDFAAFGEAPLVLPNDPGEEGWRAALANFARRASGK